MVLGRSLPANNDETYFYIYGDVRKYPGSFGADIVSAGGSGDFATFGDPRPASNTTTLAASAKPTAAAAAAGSPGSAADVSRASSPSATPRPLLMFQGTKGSPANFDLEACGDLANPEEVRGNICLVARQGCTQR